MKKKILAASFVVFTWASVARGATTTDKTYPKDFLWGAAFSAHQAEGSFGGAEAGDWWSFEHPNSGTSPIANGDNADVAIDHWHRYAEDFQIAKDLGLKSL